MGVGRHLVTWLCKAIRELLLKPLTPLRQAWEEDLDRPLHDGEWALALEYPKKVSRNTRLKNIKFHFLHSAYLSPERLQRYYPDTRFSCPRCQAPAASFQLMFWGCPTLQQYRHYIHEALRATSNILGFTSWEACALEVFRRRKTNKAHVRFASLLLLLAKSYSHALESPRGTPGRGVGGSSQEVGRSRRGRDPGRGSKRDTQTSYIPGMGANPISVQSAHCTDRNCGSIPHPNKHLLRH